MNERYRARRNAFGFMTIVWLIVGVCMVTSSYAVVFYDSWNEEGCDGSLLNIACNEDAADNIGSTTIVIGLFILLVYLPLLFGFAFQTWRFHRMLSAV